MRKLIFLYLIHSFFSIAFAQETPFHYFNTVGKFNEPINHVKQDRDGRLLLATQNGLVSYNGFTARKFITKNGTTKDINAVYSTDKGLFALNSHGQVFLLNQDTLKLVKIPGVTVEVKGIETEGEYVFFHTKKEKIIIKWSNKKVVSREPYMYAEDGKTNLDYIGFDQSEPFHILSTNELILPKLGEARQIPFISRKIKYAISIDQTVVIAGDKAINGDVVAYSFGQFKKLNFPAEVKNAHINGISGVHGALMILTDNGCVFYNRGFKKTPSHWFKGVSCTDAFVDDSGNIWIATKSNGLILIPKGKHKKITSESASSVQYYKGDLIVGNNSAGISRYKANGDLVQRLSNENLLDNVSKVEFDNVFSSYFVQTGILSGTKLFNFGKRFHSKARNKTDDLYLATSSGLFFYPKIDLKTFIRNSKKDNFGQMLLDGNCFILEKAADSDQMLVANEAGVFTVSGLEVKEIKRNGKSLHASSACWFKGSWYVISGTNVFYEITNGKVVDTRNLNQFGVINVMKLQATESRLYLLTETGLYRTLGMKAPFEALKDVMGFDGIFIRDFCAVDDEVYLATQRGVFSYIWKDVKPALAHFVVGDPFSTDKEETDTKRFFSGSVSVPVECIDLTGTRSFRLQYRLVSDGEPGEWVEALPESRKISLSNLARGKYRIEIRMIDPVSRISTKIQRRTFDVPYEWYQLKLLWVSLGVALVLCIQFVMKKLRPKKEKPKRTPKVKEVKG